MKCFWSKRSLNGFEKQISLACKISVWAIFPAIRWILGSNSFLFFFVLTHNSSLLPGWCQTGTAISSTVTAGRRWGIMEFLCIAAWCWYAPSVAHSNRINHRKLCQKCGRSTFSANTSPRLQKVMSFWGSSWWSTPSCLSSYYSGTIKINRSKHKHFVLQGKLTGLRESLFRQSV